MFPAPPREQDVRKKDPKLQLGPHRSRYLFVADGHHRNQCGMLGDRGLIINVAVNIKETCSSVENRVYN